MQLKILKPSTEAERSTRTTLDTIEVTPDLIRSWKLPPFQRPLRVNEKVMALAQSIKANDGVMPGVFAIGILNKERYLIDGQHRREAFLLSECLVGYADVRICHFENMAEMGQEYVNLNSRIVTMRPDDIMRGLEDSYPALAKIRRRCPFVGYDQIRRNERNAPVLSMSALLRSWTGSAGDTPKSGGVSAAMLATTLTDDTASEAIEFLEIAFKAWGRDNAYSRLWGNLNLTICMWLYRRIVLGFGMTTTSRIQRMSRDHFSKCLMSLSASDYVDWLLGRNSMSRDNSPAYSRIKTIFVKRMESEVGKKIVMPQPAWAVSK